MRRGFTLIEVVVALIVLEIAMVGVAGMLELGSSTLARAEALESAVAVAEGALDSLRQATIVEPGVRSFGGGDIVWSVADDGALIVRAVTREQVTLFVIHALLPDR